MDRHRRDDPAAAGELHPAPGRAAVAGLQQRPVERRRVDQVGVREVDGEPQHGDLRVLHRAVRLRPALPPVEGGVDPVHAPGEDLALVRRVDGERGDAAYTAGIARGLEPFEERLPGRVEPGGDLAAGAGEIEAVDPDLPPVGAREDALRGADEDAPRIHRVDRDRAEPLLLGARGEVRPLAPVRRDAKRRAGEADGYGKRGREVTRCQRNAPATQCDLHPGYPSFEPRFDAGPAPGRPPHGGSRAHSTGYDMLTPRSKNCQAASAIFFAAWYDRPVRSLSDPPLERVT